MLDLVSLGECMVELFCDGSLATAGQFSKAYGGDALNTAVAASRLGSRVGFISKLGDDPFASFLREEFHQEGIDLTCCPVVPGFNGLYLISLTEKGQREFIYYRAGSAASTLRADELNPAYIRGARLLHASGISQAISASCHSAVRRAFEIAREAGVRTSYDPNYRPRLWSADEAKEALDEILPLTEILLPSAPEDTQTLFGTTDAGLIDAWVRKRGVQILAIKEGEAGCVVASGEGFTRVDGLPNVKAVDTSGAGDAFNGGFLHGLLQGLDPVSAARLGVVTAGLKIAGRGAVRSLPRREEVTRVLRGEAWAAKVISSLPSIKRKSSSRKVLVAFIDGGARSNPGPAGVGVHLKLDGRPWRGLYAYLGKRTNNFAEYSALLCALRFALNQGFVRLDVYSDSQLLVRQILGEYRVKDTTLQALHRQAFDLIQELEKFSIHHVLRERNREADALANKAMDLGASGEEHY